MTTATLEPVTETTTPTAPAAKPVPTSYERLTKSSYAHSMPENWRRIHFTETGKARLAHTIGLLQGMNLCNPVAAHKLADDLVKYLDYLNGYAGDLDSPEGNKSWTGEFLKYPAYRIVLGDDGGIGSFSIGWYRAIPHKAMMDLAQTIADTLSLERHQFKHEDLKQDDARPIWDEALEASRTQLKLRKELEEYRMYRPEWDTEKTFGFCYEWVSYGYCFNGGLIFHYGDDITKGHWSTHT